MGWGRGGGVVHLTSDAGASFYGVQMKAQLREVHVRGLSPRYGNVTNIESLPRNVVCIHIFFLSISQLVSWDAFSTVYFLVTMSSGNTRLQFRKRFKNIFKRPRALLLFLFLEF